MALVTFDTAEQVLVQRLLFKDDRSVELARETHRSPIAMLNASRATTCAPIFIVPQFD